MLKRSIGLSLMIKKKRVRAPSMILATLLVWNQTGVAWSSDLDESILSTDDITNPQGYTPQAAARAQTQAQGVADSSYLQGFHFAESTQAFQTLVWQGVTEPRTELHTVMLRKTWEWRLAMNSPILKNREEEADKQAIG